MKAEDIGGNQAGLVKRTGRFGDDKDPNVGANTRFKKGQSGNPAGAPKGRRLSTVIQDMLNDPGFIERLAENLPDGAVGPDDDYQGVPMRAIITAAMLEAMDPNASYKARAAAREWLAKYGFGTKIDVSVDAQVTANPYAGLTTEELRKLAEMS